MPDADMKQVEERIAEQQQRALIPTGQDTQLSMDLLGGLSDRIMRESHSFSGPPVDVLRQIGLCQGADVISGDEAIETPIDLVHWYMHETGKESEKNGEMYNVIRTVLVDKNGKRYSTTSDWVARDVYRVAFMLGRREFNPPYRCMIQKVKGGKFNNVFRLVPA